MKPLPILLLFAALSTPWCVRTTRAQSRVPNIEIVGRVRDAATGDPVAAATVEIEGTSLLGRADSLGWYRLTRVRPGPQVLRVRRLGYAPARIQIAVGGAGTIRQDLVLARNSLRLKTVNVTADAAGRAKGELGTASVIDRDAIANQSATSLAGVLELVPGVALSPPGLDGVEQFALRSVTTSRGSTGASGPSAGDLASFGTLIIVDGVPRSNNANLQTVGPRGEVSFPTSAGGGVDLRLIPAATLERVEVVRGIPSVRYGDLTQGVVLVETRAGAFRPEVQGRYDPNTMEASLAGGSSLSQRHVGAATLDAARTRLAPGIRDDDVVRLAGQLSHRWTPGDFANSDSTSRFLLDSRLDVNRLESNNPERPDVAPGYTNWSHETALRLSERLRIGDRHERRVELSASLDYGRQTAYSQRYLIRGAQPFTDRLTEGRSVGRFVGGAYLTRVNLDGDPRLVYTRAEMTSPWTGLGFGHQLIAGAEWRREWNAGAGYQFDMEFPPQATFNGVIGFDRPRRFDAVPPVATSAWYAGDRLVRTVGGRVPVEAQVGARVELLHRGTTWFSGARDAVVQPRGNVQVTPWSWLRLRAGAGRTAKMPSLNSLYPSPQYFDVVNVNWYVPEPAERLAVLTTFIRDPANDRLGFSIGKKAEAGLELDVGHTGATIAFVAFDDAIEGGVGLSPETGFITRDYYQLDDSTGGTGHPPNIIEPPSASVPVPIAVLRPLNDQSLRNRGFEVTALLPEIPQLRTRVQAQGAWTSTRFSSSAVDFGTLARFSQFQLDSATARIPFYDGVTRTGLNAIATYRVIHHQPQLGLIITASVQHNIRERVADRGAVDTMAFAGYVTRTGELVRVAPVDRARPEYHDLRVSRSGLFGLDPEPPADWFMSLQVSKTLPGNGRLSAYLFNALDRLGTFDRRGIIDRVYPAMRFGVEATFPLSHASER